MPRKKQPISHEHAGKHSTRFFPAEPAVSQRKTIEPLKAEKTKKKKRKKKREKLVDNSKWLQPVAVQPTERISPSVHSAFRRGYQRAMASAFRSHSVAQWVLRHYRTIPQSTSEPGRPRHVRYQLDLMDVIGMTGGPEKVVFLKSSRIGYTTILLAMCSYFAHAGRLQNLHVPVSATVNAFGKTKILPTFQDCKPVSDMMVKTDRAPQSYSLFQIGGKTLRILGSRSPNEFKSHDADCIWMDEIDELSPDVGKSVVGTGTGKDGQGDPISMAQRAYENSPFRKMSLGSTPTTVNTSIIWMQYQLCPIQFAFHVPCPHCGELDALYWENLHWDKNLDSVEEAAKTASYICRYCAEHWHYPDLLPALREGRWQVAETLTTSLYGYSDEKNESKYVGWHIHCQKEGPPLLLDANGKEREWPSECGFHIWRIYSPFSSWERLVYRWLMAQNSPEMMKSRVLQDRGIPWIDRENEIGADELSKNRVPLYPLPSSIRWVTCAIDVQQEFISMLVVGWTMDKTAHIIEQRTFTGSLLTPGQGAWEEAVDWFAEPKEYLMREDGRQMRPSALAIDSGHKTRIVYEAAPHFGKHVRYFIIKGRGNFDTPLVSDSKDHRTSRGRKIKLFTIGTNQGKDHLMSMVKGGKLLLSNDLSLVPLSVEEELGAEKKVREYIGGRHVIKWHKPSNKSNEAFDQMVYSIWMLHAMNPSLRSLNPLLEPEPEQDKEEQEQPNETPPAPPPQPPRVINRRRTKQRGRKQVMGATGYYG